jgi:hypothetical protein
MDAINLRDASRSRDASKIRKASSWVDAINSRDTSNGIPKQLSEKKINLFQNLDKVTRIDGTRRGTYNTCSKRYRLGPTIR